VTTRPRRDAGGAVYRALLRAFPRPFRARFGADMSEAFADRRRAAGAVGIGAVAGLWARTLIDVTTHGWSERRAERSRSGRSLTTGSRRMFTSVLHDVRQAVRGFRSRPGLAGVALLTLALGIGANTAIFSVVHAVLIRDLPYPEGERLVHIYATHRRYNFEYGSMNPFDYTYIERRAASIAHIAVINICQTSLTGAGDPERLTCSPSTASMFDVIGVRPARGRPFTEAEAESNARVVVISDRLWRTRFGSRPDMVGQSIELDDRPWTVVGIMPPRAYPFHVDIWRPYALTPELRANMGTWFMGVFARLKPGVTVEGAHEEIEGLGRQLEAEHPARRAERGFRVAGLQADLASRSADGLRLLQGVALFVLLIACVNVANLLLAQVTARRREFGVRSAMGGSRARLIRQSLTESVVLAAAGASAGVVIALWGTSALVAMAPPYLLPEPESIGVSWPVLAVTAGASVLTGLVFGAVPAWLSSKPALAGVMGSGAREAAGGLTFSRRQWLRSTLVAVEVALAIVLVAGAGLLVKSFATLLDQAPGFDPRGVLTAQVSLPAARYGTPELKGRFWSDLVERLGALPGVQHAGGTTALPFSTWEWQTDFAIEGREDVPNDGAGIRTVTPDYFRALGMPLLAGRAFDATDVATSEPVAIVSDAFAAQHMGGLNPVGHRLRLPSSHFGFGPQPRFDWARIVGVVPATRHRGLDEEPRPEIYRVLAQDPHTAQFQVALRTTGDPEAIAPALRAAVHALDAKLPVQGVKPLADLIADRLASRRFYMTLLTLFATLAAALAATGIFGVMAYVVSQGRREIGIRLALGARPGQVRSRVLVQGLTVVAAGAVAGLIGARLLSPLLSDELFRVTPTDPSTYAAAAALLLTVATLSCWIPARRTTRVDPAVVLRE
jgi:putative ABC transport system permease protein